ncbi:MAG TPA: hypothetical protein VL651_07115 [Bacteroidia bacterium]|jgi:hypothetical protein|nr:hypothetical protein [Bacteroidia bacterium]
MANHESNGHSEDHDHDNTEGNHQYYPKGWYLPLVGLVVIALGFTALGSFAFSISGTDRWGKTEQCCDGNGACCKDDKCMDANGNCTMDKDHCKDTNSNSSSGTTTTTTAPMNDSAKPADHH